MRLLAQWLGHPLVSFVLAAAVAADVAYWRVACIGHDSLLGGPSVVSSRAVRSVVRWPSTALVEGPDGALSLRARGTASASARAQLLTDESQLPPGARLVANLRCPVVTTTAGLAGPAVEVTPYSLVIEPADVAGLSAREEVAGRYLFSRYLEGWLWQRGEAERARVVPGLLARGDGVLYRVRVRGVLHDCVVAACVAIGVVSLGLCPRWVVRRVRGLPSGVCGACGYDLRGLRGDVCPECGRRGTAQRAGERLGA